MCRQGGYYDQAVFLARKHGEHEIVVDVLIEDSKKYDEALDYLWRLEPHLAYQNLMKYARVLLEHCPKDATQLFIDYYTGQYRPKKDQPLLASPSRQTGVGIGLSTITSYIPLAYRQSQPGFSAAAGAQSARGETTDASEAASSEPPLQYNIPKPRTAFSAFVDHPDEFIVFLEACLGQEQPEESDTADLYTALFEMYLDIASHKIGSEKGEWEGKARKIINNKSVGPRLDLRKDNCLTSIRYQSTRPMCCCYLTFRHMRMALSSCASAKACASTYSDRTHLLKTLLVRSKL